MQARYYDPLIGRFLSIDPVGFSTNAPGMFNRYAYTLNDPVNNVDPDGRENQRVMDRRNQAVRDLVLGVNRDVAAARVIATEELQRFAGNHNNIGDARRHAE